MSVLNDRFDRNAVPTNSSFYYEAPGAPSHAAPRVLLITYHFPPDPVVGGLRWQQMTRHFGERGWVTDVVTRDFAGVAGLDRTRLDSLAPGTRIFSVPDQEPVITGLQRTIWPWVRRFRRHDAKPIADSVARHEVARAGDKRAIVRAYLAWHYFAREEKWALAAARVGEELARLRPYMIAISSGPPHMAHVASLEVGRRTGLPFVADMRDPWSMVEHLPEEMASPVWYRIARRHERRVISNAALVTMNTDPGREAMQAIYPDFAERITTIRNGCDDDAMPDTKRDGVFRIRFAGSIYIDRDPRPLFRAAARVIGSLGLTPEQLLVEFVGEVDRYAGIPTMTIAEEEGIAAYVRVDGPLRRNEVLEFLASATVLLSLPQDSDYAIPAKIYEYMRASAWMLVLSPPHGATARLLENTDADVLDSADVDGMVRAIKKRFEQFTRGELPKSVGRDGRFDRRVQSEKLMNLIEEISGRPGGGGSGSRDDYPN